MQPPLCGIFMEAAIIVLTFHDDNKSLTLVFRFRVVEAEEAQVAVVAVAPIIRRPQGILVDLS